jgi:ABC-2 type transport system ATP-binding protein
MRIDVAGLRRTFEVTDRDPGIKAALRSIISRSYREIVAVDGVTFTVEPGEIVGFLGPNGAGKTTTLKVIAGLLTPTAGTVRVGDFVPHERDPRYLMRLGFIMGQRHQLHFDLPVTDGLDVRRVIYGLGADDYRSSRDELVEMLGIGPFLNQPVRKLSLGQRMRAELAATLLHRPSVVLLDEPTLGLDFEAQHQIRTFIANYVERHGAAVILTSHYLADVEALCERVIAIAQGRVRYDGGLHALAARAGTGKRVVMTLSAPIAPRDAAGLGTVIEHTADRLVVEVPRESTGDTVNRALATPGVENVDLVNPPLEDRLADIYKAETG